MSFEVILLAGKLVKHAGGALLLCWRRVLRAMLLTGVVGVVLTEVVASVAAHRVLPGIPAFIVALALGATLAYCAAVTVLIDEMLIGALDAVHLLEGDVRAGLRAADVLAERDAGGVLGWLGYHRTPRTPRTPIPIKPLPLIAGASQRDQRDQRDQFDATRETRQAIADTNAFTTTAPQPAVGARPVRADQLPRIEWANEQADTRPTPAAPSAAFAPAPLPGDMTGMPPLPPKEPVTPTAGDASTEDVANPPEARGVWSRISQALVGTIPQSTDTPAAPGPEPSRNIPASSDDGTTRAS